MAASLPDKFPTPRPAPLPAPPTTQFVRKQMTKFQLLANCTTPMSAAAGSNLVPRWTDSNGNLHRGFLVRLEPEDGSGTSFNVTIRSPVLAHKNLPDRGTFHIRLLD